MSQTRQLAASGGIQVGTTFTVSRTFTAEDVAQFGDLTRDYNPVHYDARWCELKGFAAEVSHGLLVGSMICEPGGQIGWLATGMSFRFRRPVYIGDTVSCELTINDIDERHYAHATCELRNQHGDVVITGTLEGYLPAEAERELLARMLAEDER